MLTLWRFLAFAMHGVGGLALVLFSFLTHNEHDEQPWYIIFPARGRMERDVRRKELLLAQTGLESKVYVLGVPRHPATTQLPQLHHHQGLTALPPA